MPLKKNQLDFIENISREFNDVNSTGIEIPDIIHSYSLSNIVGYRRCRRQYGLILHRNFVTPSSGEVFFGTLIHQVLDRAHYYYKDNNSIPSKDIIKEWVSDVSTGLKLQGIRPLSKGLEERAKMLISTFNNKLGNYVYPQIIDTEYKVQHIDEYLPNKQFVMHGVLDVVKVSETNSSDVQIWDYKASRIPEGDDLKNYIYQMQVYSHLYEIKNQKKPQRAVLIFLGEIDHNGNEKLKDQELLDKICSPIEGNKLKSSAINEAVNEFKDTINQIEEQIDLDRKDYKNAWKEPDNDPPTQMCETCYFRWGMCTKGKEIIEEKKLKGKKRKKTTNKKS